MPPGAPISVLIADHQRLLADALARSLNLFPDISVLEDLPESGLATVDLVELFHPDVLLIDYWMPEMMAPAVARAIHNKAPKCRILVMSWLHGSKEVHNSLYAGASGFLPKGVTVDQVAEAVRRAHSGEMPVYGKELQRLLATLGERDEEASALWAKLRDLNRRELQILAMLSVAKPIKDIAETLSISPRTARNYLDNMLKKTGAQSQVELLQLARRCGLIAG